MHFLLWVYMLTVGVVLTLDMHLLGQVPQQPNGSDCGFYVMAFMRYLVAVILQDGASKTRVSVVHT